MRLAGDLARGLARVGESETSRGRACEGRPKRASGKSGRERSVATSASNFIGLAITKDAHGFVRTRCAGLKRSTAT